jgi:phage-related baseplate assembly protein
MTTTVNAAHTPGPWDFHIADNAEPFHIAIEANDERIADVYGKANARLIAAAPDMLEALRVLLAMYDEGRLLSAISHQVNFARVAITKAEGGAV